MLVIPYIFDVLFDSFSLSLSEKSSLMYDKTNKRRKYPLFNKYTCNLVRALCTQFRYLFCFHVYD